MNTELENFEAEADPETPKLNLDVKVDTVSACERHVTVTVSREDIDRYFRDKFDEIAPKAEVPGFRLGKAPRQLLENRFRKQIANQVKGALLMDSFAQINEQQEFSAISEPDFDYEVINLPDEGPFIFEFNIEVRPDFELPEYKGMELKKYSTSATEQETDRAVNELLEEFGDLEPVDEPAELGDLVVVNVASYAEGKRLSHEEELEIRIKPTLSLADATIDGFDKLMVGAKAGETVKTSIVMGESSLNESLHGQTVELEFEVLDVKRLNTNDLESVAAKLGAQSVEELRAQIGNYQNKRLEYQQRQFMREQISELLTESAEWSLPNDLLKRQARRELERKVLEMRRSGFNESQIRAQENYLRQNAIAKTEMMLKEHFILERIAEVENIQETDEDYDLEIVQIAAQRNDSPRRVRAALERNGQMDALRNMIIEQKVIDLIVEHAKTVSVEPEPAAAGTLDDSTAIDFFVAGDGDSDIPEAKYDDQSENNLPSVGKTERKDGTRKS